MQELVERHFRALQAPVAPGLRQGERPVHGGGRYLPGRQRGVHSQHDEVVRFLCNPDAFGYYDGWRNSTARAVFGPRHMFDKTKFMYSQESIVKQLANLPKSRDEVPTEYVLKTQRPTHMRDTKPCTRLP